LWIDEIEAGISTQGFKAEGGASSRVLGYFLTWMQEKRHPVFVAATANAIEMLPAEILRKGRFDEIFYVALPGFAEREEIFRIHLSKREIDPDTFDCRMLAHSSKGFSGAEIEQAVVSASFEALAQNRVHESAGHHRSHQPHRTPVGDHGRTDQENRSLGLQARGACQRYDGA
jgi:SpoVK/Ycf46/Vps4 family AAA+-type ATPase